MPELPEVETVCRGLEKALRGRVIAAVKTSAKRLRLPIPKNIAGLAGQKVTSITRRAKYILIHLHGRRTLIVHLGMSGRLIAAKTYTSQKHDHMVLTLDNGIGVTFNDARRFGGVALCETDALSRHPLFAHLGPEPLEKTFSPAYLAAKLKGKKTAIKIAIMDQRVVVGVGNIYASEALFHARLHPARAAGSLTLAEVKKLISAVRRVLRAAIHAGGSSLRDYVQADGELGYFQHSFAVYGRAGKPCRGCTCVVKKTGGVQRLTQSGRTTFYCPEKQR